MADIVNFSFDQIKFLIYQSLQYFLSSFELIGLSVQEKKLKTDFQNGGCGSHLGLLIGMILAIFDVQVTPIVPTKF